MIRQRVLIPVVMVLIATAVGTAHRYSRTRMIVPERNEEISTIDHAVAEPSSTEQSTGAGVSKPPRPVVSPETSKLVSTNNRSESNAVPSQVFAGRQTSQPEALTFEEMTSTRSDDLTAEASAVEGFQIVNLRGRFHNFIQASPPIETNNSAPSVELQNKD
jgi:hypothetical protein